MFGLNPISIKTAACWSICARDSVGAIASSAGFESADGLWRMIAVVGVAGLVLCALQALRRKPGSAVLAFLCGIGLLGAYASVQRGGAGPVITIGTGEGTNGLAFVVPPITIPRPPQPVLPGAPGIVAPLPEKRFLLWDDEETGDWERESASVEQEYELFERTIRELGTKFRSIDHDGLATLLADGDVVLGLSDLRDSEFRAEREALEDAAAQLRLQVRDKIALHSRRGAEKLDEHADDIDEAVAELLSSLRRTGHMRIITRRFGSPDDQRHRTAVRINPEQVVHDLEAKLNRFLQAEMIPRGRRLAATAVSMIALGILVFLAYLFLNTGTRGHFSGTLRILAAITFVGICGALWYVIQG